MKLQSMIETVSGSTISVQRNPLERPAQHVSDIGHGYTVHFDFKIKTVWQQHKKMNPQQILPLSYVTTLSDDTN